MAASVSPGHTGYRFPAEVIRHAVRLYFRFPLSLRHWLWHAVNQDASRLRQTGILDTPVQNRHKSRHQAPAQEAAQALQCRAPMEVRFASQTWFGLLATNCRASSRLSLVAISARVVSVAVAVSAIRGTSGQRSCSMDSSR